MYQYIIKDRHVSIYNYGQACINIKLLKMLCVSTLKIK